MIHNHPHHLAAAVRCATVGDINSITVGDKTNIQDNVVVHLARHSISSSSGGPSPTVIGAAVTIGHAATCTPARLGTAAGAFTWQLLHRDLVGLALTLPPD